MSNSNAVSAVPATGASFGLELPHLADVNRTLRSSHIDAEVLRGCTRVADIVIAAAIGLVLAITYVGDANLVFSASYLTAIAATSIVVMFLFDALEVYARQTRSSIFRLLPRIVLGWSGSFALLVAAVFFLKTSADFSRAWLAMWFVIGGTGLIAAHVALAGLIATWKKQGRLYRRAVIFGSGDLAEDAIARLEADTASDIRICGVFDERAQERTTPAVAGYPVIGNLSGLLDFSRKTRIDTVILTLPISAQARINNLMKHLFQLPADIKLPANSTSVRFSPSTYSLIGNVPMIDILDKPMTGWGTILKWTFDKVVGFTALVLLAPVMAAVAAAIKLDSPGPVFFRQKRYGFNNNLIEVFKFRSMQTNLCDANAARLVTKDDPRVTRVGRFIRKTSLDELPQLLNVLKGNLSLVGPRPHALSAKAEDKLYDEVVEGYFARHKVKPGITGWAQISGWRGETDTSLKIQKRVQFDLEYIENWSVFFDFYILAKTPLALMKTENAY